MEQIPWTNVYTCVALSLAIGVMAMTITKTKIFRPVRIWTLDKSEWFGDLISCPYCTSHWLSFVLTAIYSPLLFNSGIGLLDWFLTSLCVIAGSAVVSGTIFYAFAQMADED